MFKQDYMRYSLHENLFENSFQLKNCDCCLYELRTYVYTRRKRRGIGDGRQGPRVCYGKSMSAMHGLFGGGICGPEHCCSLDIELGRSWGEGRNHPPEHFKCVYAQEHTQANNSSLQTPTQPPPLPCDSALS